MPKKKKKCMVSFEEISPERDEGDISIKPGEGSIMTINGMEMTLQSLDLAADRMEGVEDSVSSTTVHGTLHYNPLLTMSCEDSHMEIAFHGLFHTAEPGVDSHQEIHFEMSIDTEEKRNFLVNSVGKVSTFLMDSLSIVGFVRSIEPDIDGRIYHVQVRMI